MSKPVVILDPHWRQMSELFSDHDLNRLKAAFDVIWGRDEAMPADAFKASWSGAFAYVSATPNVTADGLKGAPDLKAVVEVSGHFPETIDYQACADRGVHVLSCAPGFQRSVAEMAVAMLLAGGRGLVAEHEAFRTGDEHWLDDNVGSDFTAFSAKIGFVGFGAIARETARLLAPFAPQFTAYDPWLPEDVAATAGVSLATLDEVMAGSQAVIVAAAPSRENEGLVSRDMIAKMPKGAMLIVISRAHLVDFDAVLDAADAGLIRAAVDVFPTEPLAPDHRARKIRNIILSPHRAAAVERGRHLIGEMLVDDLIAINAGQAPSRLHQAANLPIELLTGVGNAAEVEDMAGNRST